MAKNTCDQSSFDMQPAAKLQGPVECFGMTFENDEKRREYFLEKLREKLKDPEFRKIEGFPIGSDEDILALSDPPYYTACPNPFLEDFIRCYGKPYSPNELYSRKPFAVDVSEGKTDPIYKAHSYHTKVPHLAIVPSILHYTEPGDVVLDGFCGSGMTGVAAHWCGSAPEDYRRKVEDEFEKRGLAKPKWGARRAVLNDLSPAATFISSNYNLPFDVREFARAGKRILDEVEQEIGWMYRTLRTEGKGLRTESPEKWAEKLCACKTVDEIRSLLSPQSSALGIIEYTVWSEVFTCPDCAGEVVFLDEALDEETKRVKDSFPCPHCGSNLTKDNLQRVFEARPDPANGKPWKRVKYQPSLISYTAGGKRHEKQPDAFDLEILKRIEVMPLPAEMPALGFPFADMWEAPRLEKKGFTHTHHLFLPRAAHSLTALWRKANVHPDVRNRHILLFLIEQAIVGLSVLNRYQPIQQGRPGGSQVNRQLTGVYYVASQIAECSPQYNLAGKLDRLTKAFGTPVALKGSAALSTSTTAHLGSPDGCIDYIFTDPPFGDNYPYAELNYLVESWHRVITNATPEAIVDRAKKNRTKQKGLFDYTRLMQSCFSEYYRVLKPGRWMTLVFSNSKNAVWHAIQEALSSAGFVVADVRTLNKKQGSFKQVTSMAVKQDLVISAYRPNGGLEERFRLEAGTTEGVWDFVRTHLKQLAVFVSKDDQAEVIAERQNYLLFDRMVAFHVQRGVTVPLSAAEFYAGLAQRFSERDGMYFLPEQVAEYDKKRMTVREVLQLQFFVTDESSAIQWLKQQLIKKPQTFQEMHPQFLKEIGGWQKYEKPLELSELLEQNFLRYDGKGEVPNQIHSYLSTNFKELRNLPKDDKGLRAKGKDRWYVPDPNKAGDLEKLRERSLLKEFEDYRTSSQKRLKVFRLEAVRAGFKKAWQERDYATIITVVRKLPENVLQEDPKLLMWYDHALTRSGDDA
jgi:DNA modification methylase